MRAILALILVFCMSTLSLPADGQQNKSKITVDNVEKICLCFNTYEFDQARQAAEATIKMVNIGWVIVNDTRIGDDTRYPLIQCITFEKARALDE